MLKPRAIGRQVSAVRNSVVRRTYIAAARSRFSEQNGCNSPMAVRLPPFSLSAQFGIIQSSRSYSSAKEEAQTDLKRTPLYDLHVQNGGNMVPFGGHAMPVEYKDLSIVKSALWTREKASIFDVSHMTQHKFVGDGAAAFLETVAPASSSSLKPFQSTYSALLNDTAGIVDDTIITNITESVPTYHVVTNAANYDVDLQYFQTQLERFKADSKNSSKPVSWEVVQNTGLVALQGPIAAEILGSLHPEYEGKAFDLDSLSFGHAKWLTFRDSKSGNVTPSVLVSRTGYTGEDGFELSIPHPEPSENATLKLTEMLLSAGGPDRIRLAGLGARDALRLEAGLCLHGHDLNDTRNPVEASLLWIIPKARRSADGGFNGSPTLYGSGSGSKAVRRKGMLLDGKAAAREGDLIFGDEAGSNEIGIVTSGGPSPTMQRCIAMGYVDKDAKIGAKIWIKVRGKLRAGEIVKMPFVPTKYKK